MENDNAPINSSKVSGDTTQRFSLGQMLTSGITLALAGFVSWVVATIHQEREIDLSYNQERVKVLDWVATRQPTLALFVINFYEFSYTDDNPEYAEFLRKLREYIDRSPDRLASPTPATELINISIPDGEMIRDQFYSPARREYSEYLVDLYNKETSDAEKQELVAALLNAIETGARAYRINIYIALTFSRLPRAALSDPESKAKLLGLKSTDEYDNDSQFRLNVDNALAKQGLE